MSGSCAGLFAASRIGLHSQAQFLPGAEGHHAPRRNRDLFAGLGIAAGPLVLVAQFEIPEARELHLLSRLQARADLLEEQIDKVLCLALVQAKLLEQRLGQLRLGQRHRRAPYDRNVAPNSRSRLAITAFTAVSISTSVRVRE